MDDAVFVRLLERGSNLQADGNPFLFRQGTFAQALTECFAGNVLHDEEIDSVLVIEVVDRSNVWMVELGQGQGFLAESFARRVKAQLAGREHFQGNIAVEALIPSAIDHAHSPGADLFDDLVMADSLADHGMGTCRWRES